MLQICYIPLLFSSSFALIFNSSLDQPIRRIPEWLDRVKLDSSASNSDRKVREVFRANAITVNIELLPHSHPTIDNGRLTHPDESIE